MVLSFFKRVCVCSVAHKHYTSAKSGGPEIQPMQRESDMDSFVILFATVAVSPHLLCGLLDPLLLLGDSLLEGSWAVRSSGMGALNKVRTS